jgi:hypothetical protein
MNAHFIAFKTAEYSLRTFGLCDVVGGDGKPSDGFSSGTTCGARRSAMNIKPRISRAQSIWLRQLYSSGIYEMC